MCYFACIFCYTRILGVKLRCCHLPTFLGTSILDILVISVRKESVINMHFLNLYLAG